MDLGWGVHRDPSTLKAESEDKELKGTPGYKERPYGKSGREGEKG